MGELLDQMIAGGPQEATGADRAALMQLANYVASQTGLEWFNAGHSNDSPESPRYVALYNPAAKTQIMLADIPHDRMPSDEAIAAVRRGEDWKPQYPLFFRGYLGRVWVTPRPHWPDHCWHTLETRLRYVLISLRHAVHMYGKHNSVQTRNTLAAMRHNPAVETGGKTGLDWRFGLAHVAGGAGLRLSEFGQELYLQWSALCAELLEELRTAGTVAWTPAHEQEYSDLVWLPKDPVAA